MADYKPGEMDITTQEKTFEGFMTWVVRVGIVVLIALIFLAIFRT